MYKFIGVVSNGDRWENIQKIYESLGVNVRFKTYEDAHTPLLATQDIEDEIKEITKEYQK